MSIPSAPTGTAQLDVPPALQRRKDSRGAADVRQLRTCWLVHDTGRTAHLVTAGKASCGEPGVGWRTVPGATHCAQCSPEEPETTDGMKLLHR